MTGRLLCVFSALSAGIDPTPGFAGESAGECPPGQTPLPGETDAEGNQLCANTPEDTNDASSESCPPGQTPLPGETDAEGNQLCANTPEDTNEGGGAGADDEGDNEDGGSGSPDTGGTDLDSQGSSSDGPESGGAGSGSLAGGSVDSVALARTGFASWLVIAAGATSLGGAVALLLTLRNRFPFSPKVGRRTS